MHEFLSMNIYNFQRYVIINTLYIKYEIIIAKIHMTLFISFDATKFFS